MMTSCRTVTLVILTLLTAARPAASQAQDRAWEVTSLRATRQALEQRAQRLEQAIETRSVRKQDRADVTREMTEIRARLAEGDFKVGDRVLLLVEGEKELSDTFAVGPGRVLMLPLVGDVPLAGVLRTELQDYLTQHLAQNLRDPFVRARALVRLSIQGAVARPGYYTVSAEAVLSDALMAAGGTVQDAKLSGLRIERGGAPLWEGKALEKAIAEGWTIDDAGLSAGDQFVVPRRERRDMSEAVRLTGIVLGIPVTIYTLTKIF